MESLIIKIGLVMGLLYIGLVMYFTKGGKQRFPLEPIPKEDKEGE